MGLRPGPEPAARPRWRLRLLLGCAFALSSIFVTTRDGPAGETTPPPFAGVPVERAASVAYLTDPSNPRIAYVPPPAVETAPS